MEVLANNTIEQLLREIEENVGTDDFEYIMEDKMEEIEALGAGIELVTPILQMMERHPSDDFGVPGGMVHFVEKFSDKGYEELLVESIKRRPAMHTVWMLNSVINGDKEPEKYIKLMEEILKRNDVEEEIKASVKDFLDYQNTKLSTKKEEAGKSK